MGLILLILDEPNVGGIFPVVWVVVVVVVCLKFLRSLEPNVAGILLISTILFICDGGIFPVVFVVVVVVVCLKLLIFYKLYFIKYLSY